MLDKKAYSVLEFVVNSSDGGESVVLEKQEILDALDDTINEEDLEYCIEDLALNEMLGVKYQDSNLYVLMPLPKGRVAAEKKVRTSKLEQVIRTEISAEKFSYKKVGAIAGFWAFLGGMLATAIGFIVARLI